MENRYKHIAYNQNWTLTKDIIYELGQCNAAIKALSETPIHPDYRRKLLGVSITKGAQSTTAIEGNTLTDDEVVMIQEGKKLPPGKEYQQREVENIINAFNELLREAVDSNSSTIINESFLLRLHTMVGVNLGENFQDVPGRFRETSVVVGSYRAPAPSMVKDLSAKFFEWMRNQFHYEKGQNFIEAVIQAIVSHVYIAWIHPFGDGNGRTARLLEFYILLRAGNPDFALHLLSNFYNQTRPQYYRHLEQSTRTGDLTEFIAYAVWGYGDGLFEILEIIQRNQIDISWKNYIYNLFSNKNTAAKSEVLNKRRRNLMLAMQPYRHYTHDELIKINVDIAIEYKDLSARTIKRDINELITLDLLVMDDDGLYYANYDILKHFMPRKVKRSNLKSS